MFAVYCLPPHVTSAPSLVIFRQCFKIFLFPFYIRTWSFDLCTAYTSFKKYILDKVMFWIWLSLLFFTNFCSRSRKIDPLRMLVNGLGPVVSSCFTLIRWARWTTAILSAMCDMCVHILQAMSEYSIAPEYLKTYQKAIADINRCRQDKPTFDDAIKVRIPTCFCDKWY